MMVPFFIIISGVFKQAYCKIEAKLSKDFLSVK